jgi:hypothetical protein
MGLPHHLQAPAFEQREEGVPVGAFGGIYPSLPFAQSAFVEENEVLKVPFVQLFNLFNTPDLIFPEEDEMERAVGHQSAAENNSLPPG